VTPPRALRARPGTPLILRSAYRSREHNRAVGGAKGSKHLDGFAFDVAMANDPEAFEAGARMIGPTDRVDPYGNRWQFLDCEEVQFSKAPRVLEGMGLGELEKSERALDELRAKNLAD